MIKELIEELAFDRITLTQALTRAKIIAFKIDNLEFKDWLIHELNGYNQKELPNYRKISCEVFAEVYHPLRGNYTIPFDVSNLDKDLKEQSMYKMNVTQSIPTMEKGLEDDSSNSYGYEYLPIPMVQNLKSMVSEGDSITAVKRRIQMSEIKHIIELTKQKLLDTLLELNSAFPNLENEFNKSQKEIAQTIINQNIYGNNTNSNIGIGEGITQCIESKNKIDKFIEEIKKLGIEDSDINEVKDIIHNTENTNLGKSLMKWIGKVSTKSIEKGVELQIPTLIEKINELI